MIQWGRDLPGMCTKVHAHLAINYNQYMAIYLNASLFQIYEWLEKFVLKMQYFKC